MPRRVYFCTNDDCCNTYEKYQGYEEIDRICNICGSSVFQDLTNVYGSVSEPRTLGALADKNASKMGEAKISEIERKREADFEKKRQAEREHLEKTVPGIKFIEKKKEKPWFGELPKDIKKDIFNKKGEEQKKRIEKYIHEGK